MNALDGLPHDTARAPTVTVIIAAYNAGSTLSAAIESILRQTGAEFELLIVNDGSVDATLKVAEQYATEHAGIVVLTQPHGGTAKALNLALKTARGTLITRLDADDELAGDYLAHMVRFVDSHPDFDIYSPDLLVVGPDGPPYRLYGWPETRSVDLSDMLERSVIPGAGTMARRQVFDITGGYRENVYSEDYDLWLRALAAGMKHIYLPQPLYIYRQGAETRKSADLVAAYASTVAIQRELRASGTLSDAQARKVDASIEFIESLIEEARMGGAEVRQAVVTDSLTGVRRSLSRAFGEQRSERMMVRLLELGPIFRPLWRLWVGLIVRFRGRRTSTDSGDR